MDRLLTVLLCLLTFLGAAQDQYSSPDAQIEDLYVERGGPPLNVLNVRLTVRNIGETGSIEASLHWRPDAGKAWQPLKNWQAINLPAGYKRSLDVVGNSAELPRAFEVRALVTSSSGRQAERLQSYTAPLPPGYVESDPVTDGGAPPTASDGPGFRPRL